MWRAQCLQLTCKPRSEAYSISKLPMSLSINSASYAWPASFCMVCEVSVLSCPHVLPDADRGAHKAWTQQTFCTFWLTASFSPTGWSSSVCMPHYAPQVKCHHLMSQSGLHTVRCIRFGVLEGQQVHQAACEAMSSTSGSGSKVCYGCVPLRWDT